MKSAFQLNHQISFAESKLRRPVDLILVESFLERRKENIHKPNAECGLATTVGEKSCKHEDIMLESSDCAVALKFSAGCWGFSPEA